MIGVTIGVGDYRPLAERAAAAMSAHTGCRCVILGEEQLRQVGLADRPAQWLKLWLWDFVTAERVLWFDADTVCFRDWQPENHANGAAVVATRDWNWRVGIQEEADSVGVPHDEYFLSSVMLLNRTDHEPMLRLAREILPHTSGRVFEQTAVNAARHRLGLPVRFLDRRFNWSLFGAGNLQDAGGVIVGHFNSDQLRRDVAAVEPRATDGQIDADAFQRMGNKFYRYSRIGYDERALLLRTDGTIGSGGGDAERFWFVRREADGLRLVIGSETQRTCELALDEDGIWRGRWDAYERMPIELMKHRGQVLVDLLGDVEQPWVGAELGIFEGNLSQLLLRELPHLTLWMIDRWRAPQPGERYFEDPYIRLVTPEQMAGAMARALRITDFAADRRLVVVADQVRAADCVAEGSLDFVFVDSDHSKAGTLEAIDAWWSKLRAGGLMAGHDLDYPGFPGVREAVVEAARRRHVRWQSEADFVWYFRVR